MAEKQEEINVLPLIGILQKVFKYLLRRKYVILAIAVIGAVLGYVYAVNKDPKYDASLTFVMSAESRSMGLGSLASQLGFDAGGGSDLFAGDNILTLFKSRKMVKRALFNEVPGKKETLINFFVKEFEINEYWSKNPRIKNAFPFPADTISLSGIQDSLIREIHSLIVGKYLDVGRPDKKLSYYMINTNSKSEVFSYYLTRFLMDETARFFIETKTKLAKQSLSMVQHEADSLRSLLSRNITSTAASVDRTYNLNPALQIQRAPIQRSQVNTEFLTSVYNEVAKNVITAKLNLQKEIPLYQVVDEPTLPLKIKYSNAILYAFAGFVVFLLSTVFFFLAGLLYRNLFKPILIKNEQP